MSDRCLAVLAAVFRLGDDVDGPSGWTKRVSRCADGIMAATPVELEASPKTGRRPASCGTA